MLASALHLPEIPIVADSDKERSAPEPRGMLREEVWSLVCGVVVWVVPFVPMIHWYTGSIYSGQSEERSLVTHAWWWLKEASFGPWVGPSIVVAIPPVVVLAFSLLPARLSKARLALALAATLSAWLVVAAALLKVGEDIIFTWYKMTGPLAVQAAVVTVWSGLQWRRAHPKIGAS